MGRGWEEGGLQWATVMSGSDRRGGRESGCGGVRANELRMGDGGVFGVCRRIGEGWWEGSSPDMERWDGMG